MSLMTAKQKLVPVAAAARRLAHADATPAEIDRIARNIRQARSDYAALAFVRRGSSARPQVFVTENSLAKLERARTLAAEIAEKALERTGGGSR